VAAGEATVAVKVPPAVGVQVPADMVTPFPPDVVCANVPVPSTKNTWHSFAAPAASAFAAATFALLDWLRNEGRATEARIPTIITTTKSSIKVKPLLMADPERLGWDEIF
jgi:hypothetical protein